MEPDTKLPYVHAQLCVYIRRVIEYNNFNINEF